MPRTIVKLSPISESVSRRFFKAIDRLVAYKEIRALGSFCEGNHLSASRYREMRFEYGVTPTGKRSRYKNVEIEALYALVANYSISAEWLLTGRGEMIKARRKVRNEVQHKVGASS